MIDNPNIVEADKPESLSDIVGINIGKTLLFVILGIVLLVVIIQGCQGFLSS